MALIGRLFVILFGFLAACFVAGMIVVGAVMFPEFSDLGGGAVDQGALNVVLGFGFIFLSGFALLPALIVVSSPRRFISVACWPTRSAARIVGAACYLGLVPFDTADAAVRRHRAPSSRNHDRRGYRRRSGLLDDRGTRRRRLARTAASVAAPAAAAVAFADAPAFRRGGLCFSSPTAVG